MSPEIIRVILRDWWNCSATVTITLKGSGQQFTGKVGDNTWNVIGRSEGIVTLMQRQRGLTEEQRHDIDINEIAAITAVGS